MNAPLPGAAVSGGASEALTRLDRLIERELLRLRARYELTQDEFRGLYITDEQVDALVRRSAPGLDPAAVPAAAPPAGRWDVLRRSLQLDADELDLLLLAAAPELDAKYETLFAYLNNDIARRLPTLELAQRLFAADEAARSAMRARLAPSARLIACGALEFAPQSRELPRPQRGLRVPAALVDWLLGLPWSDERLADLLTAAAAQDAPQGLVHGAEALTRLLAQAQGGRAAPPVVLSAASAFEARRAAQLALADGGLQPIALDLQALKACSAPAEAVSALVLMQAVHGAPLLAAPLDALFDADGRPLESAAVLRRLAQRVRPLVLAGSCGLRWRELLGDTAAGAVEVSLRELDVAERARAWHAALGQAAPASGAATALTLLAVADRFALGIDRIEHAAAHARELARARGLEQPEADDLFAAARALSLDGGTDVVRPVRQPFGWHDLVVPTETRQRLQDLLHAVELRPEVFDRWQFRRPCGGQRGILAMFAGASGTGKTMAAAIIARELGMELHRVELAAVMSKYIGETEKNLDRAFAAARRANAILFVDEADALLGKRSEVRDAHDRYANVEIAFLLQRMEDHDGVVIVATNLANNIDAAFSRRMHFVVQFQLPDGASRERLWQQMLPPEAPRGADLDIGYLARQFEFSGGDIRNIALDAAFHAARTRAPIGMRAVLTAVITHYAKRGRLPHANEFGPYAGLLRAAAPEAAARPPRV